MQLPNSYYNLLLKCTIKIKVHALEGGAGVQRDSNYEIRVGHCVTLACCVQNLNQLCLNKQTRKVQIFKIWYLEKACEKKKKLIKKDCFSLEASQLNCLLGMGI